MRFFKKLTVLILTVATLLSLLPSCQSKTVNESTVWGPFDSYLTVKSYLGDGKSEFQRRFGELQELANEYHRLYDIYNEYDGITNLATLNRLAGSGAVKVDQKIIDLLLFAKEIYTLTDGHTDITMGPVLKLWHDCRTAALGGKEFTLPTDAELSAAAQHVGIDKLIIDEANMTVTLTDEKMRLDVGAVAKGFVTERLAQWLIDDGVGSYVIDFGGNLRAVGHKPDGSAWQAGVQNPDVYDFERPYVYYFDLADGSAVTSGSYERYFVHGGKSYHHIIDKDTLVPAKGFSSVTVITRDGGIADALSTALFTTTYEEGMKIISRIEGMRVVWVTEDGKLIRSDE